MLAKAAQRLKRTFEDERGFTLVELLVSMVISIVVIGSATAFFVVVFGQQNDINSRLASTQQAEAGLQQLTRDLRDAVTSYNGTAYNVTVTNVPSKNQVELQMYEPNATTGSAPTYVTWTCPSSTATTVGTCTRDLAASLTSAPGNPTNAITGVQSLALSGLSGALTYTANIDTNPGYLNLTLTADDAAVYADAGPAGDCASVSNGLCSPPANTQNSQITGAKAIELTTGVAIGNVA